jgi:hypothetical protein
MRRHEVSDTLRLAKTFTSGTTQLRDITVGDLPVKTVIDDRIARVD